MVSVQTFTLYLCLPPRHCAETVCGPGVAPHSPAVLDDRPHLQQDRQAGGHLLGRDETLRSDVSLVNFFFFFPPPNGSI